MRYTEYQKEQNSYQSQLKKLYKKLAGLDKSIETLHNKEMKVASKEKRKRNKPNTGGFNKPDKIPDALRKYIGKDLLPDDVTELPRPKVLSLLNTKFKEDGLKDGHVTKLNKKAAKALGKDKGTEIKFSEYQTFLAGFY